MQLVTDPNNPVLRKKCKKVKSTQSTEVILCVQAMKHAALEWEQRNPGMYCAGLAAPQIGVSLRIVIVRKNGAPKMPQDPRMLSEPDLLKLYPEYFDATSMDEAYGRYSADIKAYEEWKNSPEGYRFDPFLVMYNPKYADGDGMIEIEEGCLSVPGMLAKTMRREKSAFWFYDENLKRCPPRDPEKPHIPTYYEATGIDSAVICHELEHLDGTLCFDNAISRRVIGEEVVEQGVDEDALEIAREVAEQDADILAALNREEAAA